MLEEIAGKAIPYSPLYSILYCFIIGFPLPMANTLE